MAIEKDSVNGCLIPKGTTLFLYVYGTHHQSSYWKNPDLFDPARFAKDAGPKDYRYLPFGGGPRLCIGTNFAMMEMQLILGQLFRTFQFACIANEVEMEPLITLRPKDGIKMRVKQR